MRAFAAAAALAFASSSCSSSPRDDAPTRGIGVSRAAIIGGSASATEHDAVVLLANEAPNGAWEYTCTGTLIAPNLLVTARHCLSAIDDPNVACDAEGNQVSGGAIGQDLRAGAFAVHRGPALPSRATSKFAARGSRIFHDGAKTLCGHDLAFLLLDRDVTTTALLPVRLDAPVRGGESIVAVGYGLTKSGVEAPIREERGGIDVRFVGPFAGSATDPPVAPNDFLVGESFCLGDSGGPALARASDAIVGIATRVGVARTGTGNGTPPNAATPCIDAPSGRVYAFYTQLSPFAAVAKVAFAASGHEPWIEGADPPWWTFDDGGCAMASRAHERTPHHDRALYVALIFASLSALTAARRSARRSRRGRTPGS